MVYSSSAIPECIPGCQLVTEQQKINQLLQSLDLYSAIIVNLEGYYYRSINYGFSKEPLSTKGAEITGGRYNFKPKTGTSFPCFYCADHEDTATTEKFYGLRLAGKPRSPHTTFAVELKLSRMLDLRSEEFCHKAGVNWESINQDWRYNQDNLDTLSYTQMISMIASKSGIIEGIIYTSTKKTEGICLAIYKDIMLSGSFLKLYDPRDDYRDVPEENKCYYGKR